MKKLNPKSFYQCVFCAFLLFIGILCPVFASAQISTVAIIDTSFASATGGKVETSFGDFNDELTDFYVNFGSKITACGKVGTPDSTVNHFGMLRLNPNGTFDSTFGTNGKEILSWSFSDYPIRLYMESDSTPLLAGSSSSSALTTDQLPTVFHLKHNGSPDSTFGVDGHVTFRYDELSSGAFTDVFPFNLDYVACGSITSNGGSGSSGFYAACFTPTGNLVSSFGTNGKAFIPADVHSVRGYISANSCIVFCGVTNISGQSVIVLGRLTPSGNPDPTFGNNGLKNTGIILTAGTDIVAAVQQDYKLLISVPSESSPFTLARFTTGGELDTLYGTKGYAIIPIAPIGTAKGINIANSGEAVINGSAGPPIEHCATARVKQTGLPDPAFNRTGMCVIDVDNRLYSNYLILFNAIGGKHYIGVGGTIQNGKLEFLIARFKDDTLHSGVSIAVGEKGGSILYPNPASTEVTFESSSYSFQNLRILDALGRGTIVPQSWQNSENANKCSLDVTDLADGIYYCIADLDGVRSVQKLIISH